jgi:hypothetical protein
MAGNAPHEFLAFVSGLNPFHKRRGNTALLKGGLIMRSVKPLALFAALLAAIAGAGLFATPAAGNTVSVTATAAGTNAFTVIASYTNTPAGVPATLAATGNGGFSSASASGATGVTLAGFVAGTKVVTTTPDTSGVATNTITIQAVFTCQGAGQVSFTLTQTGATPGTSSATPVTCTAGTGTSAGGLSVSPASVAMGQQATVSGTCQMGATLTATPPAGQFVNATVNGQPAMASGAGVQCVAAGTLMATYVCAQPGTVSFTMAAATGTLSCGQAAGANPFGQQQPLTGQQPYGAPIYTGQPSTMGGISSANASGAGSGAPVSIQVSPSNLTCGQSGTVSVSARGADGQPVNQGQVSLYTTAGAVEPKSGAISNGRFETKLTAPNTAGTATLSASVNGVNNSVEVKIDCAGGATSTTSSPMTTNSILNNPASPPPPPVAAPIISPPSTGDAGLLANG